MFEEDLKLRPVWKSLLEENADRFILGMDTYIPRLWADLPENVEFDKEWLMELSQGARDKIARENINQWF